MSDETNDIVIASWYITEISIVLLALAQLGFIGLSQSITIGFVDVSTYQGLITLVGGVTGVISLGDKLID